MITLSGELVKTNYKYSNCGNRNRWSKDKQPVSKLREPSWSWLREMLIHEHTPPKLRSVFQNAENFHVYKTLFNRRNTAYLAFQTEYLETKICPHFNVLSCLHVQFPRRLYAQGTKSSDVGLYQSETTWRDFAITVQWVGWSYMRRIAASLFATKFSPLWCIAVLGIPFLKSSYWIKNNGIMAHENQSSYFIHVHIWQSQ